MVDRVWAYLGVSDSEYSVRRRLLGIAILGLLVALTVLRVESLSVVALSLGVVSVVAVRVGWTVLSRRVGDPTANLDDTIERVAVFGIAFVAVLVDIHVLIAQLLGVGVESVVVFVGGALAGGIVLQGLSVWLEVRGDDQPQPHDSAV